MKHFTHTEIEQIIAENARLRHACRKARLALAESCSAIGADTTFDGPACPVVQGKSPLHLPTPVNIFKKGKPRT